LCNISYENILLTTVVSDNLTEFIIKYKEDYDKIFRITK
jgi:hypothetical protein